MEDQTKDTAISALDFPNSFPLLPPVYMQKIPYDDANDEHSKMNRDSKLQLITGETMILCVF